MHCNTGQCVSHMIASVLWGEGVINKIFITVINRMVVTLWSCCTMTLRGFSNQAYLHTKSDLLNLKVWFTLLSHAFYTLIFYFFLTYLFAFLVLPVFFLSCFCHLLYILLYFSCLPALSRLTHCFTPVHPLSSFCLSPSLNVCGDVGLRMGFDHLTLHCNTVFVLLFSVDYLVLCHAEHCSVHWHDWSFAG